MLLAIDVGNTQTVFGLFDGEELVEQRRIATEAQRTGDELVVLLRGLLGGAEVDGISLSSTVPLLTRAYEELAARWPAPLLVVGPGIRTGIQLRYDDPREIGPDRIANPAAGPGAPGAPRVAGTFG